MPKSIIPYPGGKQKMAKHYLSLVPTHELWCEVFCGAAHVTLMKDPSTSALEVINDRYYWLVNFWRVIKHCPAEFMARGAMAIRSRAIFEMYRDWHALAEPSSEMPDPDAAWAFWYLIRSSFTGSMSYPRWKYNKVGKAVSRNVHFANLLEKYEDIMAVYERLRHVDIECLDFRECISRYDNPTAFFFCDPPYWAPKSGPQDYVCRFTEDDHLALAEALKSIEGQFMLTYEDSEKVRDAYSWAHQVQPVEFNYSVPHDGSAGESKTGRELIITSYNTDGILGPLFNGLQNAEFVL